MCPPLPPHVPNSPQVVIVGNVAKAKCQDATGGGLRDYWGNAPNWGQFLAIIAQELPKQQTAIPSYPVFTGFPELFFVCSHLSIIKQQQCLSHLLRENMQKTAPRPSL